MHRCRISGRSVKTSTRYFSNNPDKALNLIILIYLVTASSIVFGGMNSTK